MIAAGIAVAFLGYAVTYYGLSQLLGGNWTFTDLTLPWRWSASVAATPRDGAT